jgi:5'-nucleotidase
MAKKTQRLKIVITNDDGIHAKGINALIELLKPYGDLLVVAPAEGQSAMSHAITIKQPIFLKKTHETEGLTQYSCSGTAVDCIKLALNALCETKPDFIFSGINHGTNVAISVIYSGTMAGAIEGYIHGIPSIGVSLWDHDEDADFAASVHYTKLIFDRILASGDRDFCLNVNIPKVDFDHIKGIKVCRQTRSSWVESFEKRVNPSKKEYFWLTGSFNNFEPEAQDHDHWALRNNYVSVVPIQVDFTNHEKISQLKMLEE